jgi:hypothetical protein
LEMTFLRKTWTRQFRNLHLALGALAIGSLILDYRFIVVPVGVSIFAWTVSYLRRNAE